MRIFLSLKEVPVHASHVVMMEGDNNIWLIVGNSQGILDQQLCQAHPLPLLKVVIVNKLY
jgi:hypothetical protein